MAAKVDPIDDLRASILDTRQINYVNLPFVPQDDLYRLLSPPVVLSVLKSSGLDTSRLSELAQSVHQGARKVFAILVILKQVQHTPDLVSWDHFRDLDPQLPFERDALERMLPRAFVATEFYDQQWQFLAPVFSKKLLPRELVKRIPLPITEKIKVGSGSFGTAYRIRIHPSHNGFGTSVDESFVLKSFSVGDESRDDYISEANNLSILSHLRHPYIIELLGAFTHDNEHHLIFPWAPGGDLAALLRGPAPEFQRREDWLVALCRLASAIERVHNVTAESLLDLPLIGCHHDLKPRNILVKGTTLMLADFGLSRFRDASEPSATRHRIGQGDYLAPECEDIENSFAKGTIGRSSDIWSFGCITAEILTYMLKGPDGVKDFRNQRRYRVPNYLFFHFHHGPLTPSQGVAGWLSQLESEPQVVPMLLPLIRQMLSVEPTQRPKAKEVQARLQFIAIRLIAEDIAQKYAMACERSGSTFAWIERCKFESWRHACGTARAAETPNTTPAEGFDHNFQAALDILYHVREHLESIESADCWRRERAFFPLRYFNKDLAELLPYTAQKEMEGKLESCLLNTLDTERLRDIGQALHTQMPGKRPVRLAKIKRMTLLVEQHGHRTQSSLEIDPGRVRPGGSAGESVELQASKIMVMDGMPVLVEWVQHESHVEEEIGRERLLHIDALATLLSLKDKPEEFRVLHCSAYFHDPKRSRSGIVFELPAPSVVGEPLKPLTLAKALAPLTEGKERKKRPALGDKFKLASALANSIAELHKVGWLHKNISSSTIIFFPPFGSSPRKHITRPYIIGFSHSRPAFGITQASYDIKWRDYQHPEYLQNKSQFTSKFDYYSLGMVLLEIGYWEPLQQITHDWNCPNEMLRDRLLKEKVPRLKEKMGEIYFEAVNMCLSSKFTARGKSEDEVEVDNATAVHLEYEELVVAQLAKCSA
ncbi:MAG: hypothetical protein M1824_001956 [Vezdaea acicularis]|nr:MAG: hypothetical protein M1824_001956 [Vezdaea acicularis]